MSSHEKRSFGLVDILSADDLSKLLRTVLYVLLGFLLLGTLAYFLHPSPSSLSVTQNSGMMAAISLSCILLLRRNRPSLAVGIMLAACGLVLIIAAWNGVGVFGSAYACLSLLIMGASMYWGQRVGVTSAVIASMTGIALLFAGRAGLLVNASRPVADWLMWATLSAVFILLAMMNGVMLRYLENYVSNMRSELEKRTDIENEIRNLNESLEMRIAERTAQLSASEERYRLISTVSSDYMFSTQLNDEDELELKWVAGAFEKITGYTLEEYTAHGGWLACLHPDDVDEDNRAMSVLYDNQKTTSEVRTFSKSGEERWVRTYAHPVWDDSRKQLIGIYGAVQDITENRQVEIREKNRRDLLEKVVDMGKKIAIVTSLRDCLLEIHSCILQDLGFDRVAIFLYDEENTLVRGTFGTSRRGELTDINSYSEKLVDGDSWHIAMKNRNGIFLIKDVEKEYPSKLNDPEMQGVKQHLTVSAWAGDVPIAFITVDDLLTQRKISRERIEALQLFSGYIGLAIQNARWNESLRQRVEDLDVINRVSQILVTENNLTSMIQAVGEQIRATFGVTVGFIGLLDVPTNMIHFHFQYDDAEPEDAPPMPLGEGMSSYVIMNRQPIMINSNWLEEAAKYNVVYGDDRSAKSSLTVPILIGDDALGVISLQDMEREHVFTDDHLRQLTTIAANLSVAIENIRLHQSLQKELIERKQAEEMVRKFNTELESRVVERTLELESANRELESLSYTIGHDLRSPIRAITAYSQMLLDGLSDLLDGKQADRLRSVNKISMRMGLMVDDFLTFLRLGHSDINKRTVDVTALVKMLVKSLKKEYPAQTVEFDIQPMPKCAAAENLLSQVFSSLISNAIKFASVREVARIEIGSMKHEGLDCYFVRDNGVGFDMQYASKLFGVFQRLHHEDEFEGVGIGLAIAQRIIQRHGGHIWAEAQPNEGATFYFTLSDG